MKTQLKVIKAVKFSYKPSEDVFSLFETFKRMCNDAIHVALTEKPKTRFELILRSYARLKGYGLHSHYIQNACEVAFSAYKNKNRKRDPFIRKGFLKLDNQAYRLDYLVLRIPTAARQFIFVTLHGSSYHRSFLANKSLKPGSVTITERNVIITFSKDVETTTSTGQIGIDANERNVTWSDTLGNTEMVDISETCEIRERYRSIRAQIAHDTRKDMRKSRRLLAKYGAREKNRTIQAIHRMTKAIVEHAKMNNLAIAMERLTGIRKLYRKGNGQGKSYRGRMNSWAFREVQRQIEYKANWEGIPVSFVNPRGTSRNCLCGSRVIPLQDRKLYCPRCDLTWDRDVLASKKVIMAAPMVRAALPPTCSDDGESRRQEKAGNPLSRRMEGESKDISLEPHQNL